MASATAMSKEKEEVKKEKVKWVRPNTKAEVEKLMMKNLEGFARKGARVVNHGFIPTSHFNLDFAISFGRLPINVDLSMLEGFNPKEPGGIPRGKITEVYGEEGGGKSSLCLRTSGNAQNMGLTVMWIDKENSFSEKLAKLNGCNLDTMWMIDGAGIDAEKTFELMISAMRSGVGLIVLDSVASLIPRWKYEKGLEGDTVALLARAMSKYMPTIGEVAAETGCAVVFINQIREKPGVMFGDPTTTPGGRALKFHSSLRLQVSKRFGKDAEVHKENEDGDLILVAKEAHIYIRKNRFSKDIPTGIPCPIYFEYFFPNAEQVAFDIGRLLQVVKVRNKIFYWKIDDDTKVEGKVEGRKAFIDEIVASKRLSALMVEIKKEAQEQGVVLPPEITTFKIVGDKEVKKKDAVQSEHSAAIDAYLEEDSKKPDEEPVSDETPPARTGKKKSVSVSRENTLD